LSVGYGRFGFKNLWNEWLTEEFSLKIFVVNDLEEQTGNLEEPFFPKSFDHESILPVFAGCGQDVKGKVRNRQ
jgi:hypothetical protein